jgi:hypothetical protein
VGFCAGRSRIGLLSLALLPWLAFGARAIDREVILITQHDYVNYFPQMLSPAIGSTAHVAMTEAGRLGYRLPGSKLDIVGLNSKITALGMDRVAALAGFRPDMVFLHQVWTLDTSKLDLRKNWIELSREQYAALPVLDSPADAYHTDPTHVAALAARRFVLDSPTPYFIYAVQYRGEFSHFFFLRGDGGLSKAVFEGTLDLSFLPEAVRPHCAYSDAFPCRWLARHG